MKRMGGRTDVSRFVHSGSWSERLKGTQVEGKWEKACRRLLELMQRKLMMIPCFLSLFEVDDMLRRTRHCMCRKARRILILVCDSQFSSV